MQENSTLYRQWLWRYWDECAANAGCLNLIFDVHVCMPTCVIILNDCGYVVYE